MLVSYKVEVFVVDVGEVRLLEVSFMLIVVEVK